MPSPKDVLEWQPPIMHDLHQAQTLLYTFSGQAPQNPNLDPILYGELPMMANFEMAQFAKYGMPGVWTHGFVDMWSPGYLAFMSSNHNGMIRMYEIQGFSVANTQKLRLTRPESTAGETSAARAGGASEPGGGRANQTQRQWYRSWPAAGEFDGSLRNSTNYCQKNFAVKRSIVYADDIWLNASELPLPRRACCSFSRQPT